MAQLQIDILTDVRPLAGQVTDFLFAQNAIDIVVRAMSEPETFDRWN
jgi:hypothetical protein